MTILSPESVLEPEAMEYGRWLFAQECTFITGAVKLDGMPEAGSIEVAFAGRSNVGKSSLVNALTGRKTLARTSNTPGRTQQINFFDLAGILMLADLPGYGYAKAPRDSVDKWTHLVMNYLRGRAPLRRVCLLVDSRHGLKDNDREAMKLMDMAAVSYQIIFTKADKIKQAALTRLIQATHDELKTHIAAHPELIVTSAVKSTGIAELRSRLGALAKPEELG